MTSQYARYREDADVLAAIGAAVGEQAGRITVRLPRALADAAVAAWERDEIEPLPAETPEQRVLRDRAAELALIGLAVSERGRREGDVVEVDLDAGAVGAAVRAAPR
ncbi:hypothetical protein [Amycolatopsis thermophila]|uniref:Uncharacterized protein n=1 Tax=Amycolatopsis thermophila TaxID=206084 RepID=A0ABU0F4E1_9PSEU|nr:hypothetical protein [Amycolatopsis thermophila]MDQ0381955.1 hypothetical protein [Amycolatopsis thermophila]